MPVHISTAQREALYAQVLDHLSGIGDLWLLIESREYERADALGHAFTDDLRLLLDDLGWPDRSNLPPDGSIELTMPVEDLKRVIERLRDEASQLYADTLPRSGDDREVLHRTDLAVEACGRVLSAISRGGGAG